MQQEKTVGMALRGDLTVGRCAAVRKSILQHLGRYEGFEIILDPEPAVDTAGLQLLISLKKEMDGRGIPFTIKEIPLTVIRFSESIGVDIILTLAGR